MVKPRLRYGDFSIFQDGGRRHLGFLKFEIFNGRTAQEGRTVSPCQIWSKSVNPRPRYGDFSTFPRWRPSAILDLLCVCVCSDHPRRTFIGGLYHCAKLCGIDAVVLIICMFFDFTSLAWKRLFRSRKFNSGFWGILPPKWGAVSTKPKKAHPCASPRRLSHMRENASTRLICRWVPEKRGYK